MGISSCVGLAGGPRGLCTPPPGRGAAPAHCLACGTSGCTDGNESGCCRGAPRVAAGFPLPLLSPQRPEPAPTALLTAKEWRGGDLLQTPQVYLVLLDSSLKLAIFTNTGSSAECKRGNNTTGERLQSLRVTGEDQKEGETQYNFPLEGIKTVSVHIET